MPIPDPWGDPSTARADGDGGPRDALFLDFDGTLVDVAPTPDAVLVPPDLVELLGALERALDGAVAIVTGRRIADVDRFLAPLRLVTAGGHGSEFRASGEEVARPTAVPIDPDLVDRVIDLARRTPGLLIEPKVATLAIHYRAVPEVAETVEAELRRILAEGPDHLELSYGRKVFEICPRDVSKGDALERLLALPAFRGRRPIMIGDDITDNSAFLAAERAGGRALRVAGETFPSEIADFADPDATRRWLWAFLERVVR